MKPYTRYKIHFNFFKKEVNLALGTRKDSPTQTQYSIGGELGDRCGAVTVVGEVQTPSSPYSLVSCGKKETSCASGAPPRTQLQQLLAVIK